MPSILFTYRLHYVAKHYIYIHGHSCKRKLLLVFEYYLRWILLLKVYIFLVSFLVYSSCGGYDPVRVSGLGHSERDSFSHA